MELVSANNLNKPRTGSLPHKNSEEEPSSAETLISALSHPEQSTSQECLELTKLGCIFKWTLCSLLQNNRKLIHMISLFLGCGPTIIVNISIACLFYAWTTAVVSTLVLPSVGDIVGIIVKNSDYISDFNSIWNHLTSKWPSICI